MSAPAPGRLGRRATCRGARGERLSVKANSQPKSAAILGLAFDNNDGHTRLTRGENFVLVGGSHETHSVMQETAVKVNERLNESGRRLEDVPVRELRKIFREVTDSIGLKD